MPNITKAGIDRGRSVRHGAKLAENRGYYSRAGGWDFKRRENDTAMVDDE